MFCVLLRTTFATFNRFMEKPLFIFDFSKPSLRRLANRLFAISEMCKFKGFLFFTLFQTWFYVNFMFYTHQFLFVFTWHESWMIFIIEFFWSFCCCFASCDAFQRRRIQLCFIRRRNDAITSSYTDYWHWKLWKNVNSSFYQPQNCISKLGWPSVFENR